MYQLNVKTDEAFADLRVAYICHGVVKFEKDETEDHFKKQECWQQ